MNYCIDLILDKAFCIFIYFHFPDSRLSVLKGSHLYFAFSLGWKPRINLSNHWGILYKQTPKRKKINGNWFSYKLSLQLIAIQLCCFWQHKIPPLDKFKLNFFDKAVKIKWTNLFFKISTKIIDYLRKIVPTCYKELKSFETMKVQFIIKSSRRSSFPSEILNSLSLLPRLPRLHALLTPVQK